jgi:hypothetical protein
VFSASPLVIQGGKAGYKGCAVGAAHSVSFVGRYVTCHCQALQMFIRACSVVLMPASLAHGSVHSALSRPQ